MSDKEGIPEMNGTIKALISLISTPLDTPDQQAQALRDSIKLQLHTYILQKKLLEAVDELLEERKSIISKFIDKALIPFLIFVFGSLFYLIVTHPLP